MSSGAKPVFTTRAEADLAARREREAAALRANLRRRKDQQRSTVSEPSQPDLPQTERP